ncbi:MAG: LysM peptidoglycan-binding domain-containing protein [Chthoniobacterales bacterium]
MSIRQTFLVILLASAIAGGTVYFTRVLLSPVDRPTVPWVKYVHPNIAKLKEAQRLTDDDKLPEAREILVGALTSAPRSPVTRELRDLLGEVNTRLFLQKQTSPRKIEYTVASGDALSSIARKLKSSADAIMRINELDSTLIRPGDKLFVPQLDFTITVDLPRGRVVVHDGHGFFTQYPIASVDLPKTRAAKVETRVTAKSFWENGRPVARRRRGKEEGGNPWIYLHRSGYVLYGVEESGETSDRAIHIDGEQADSDADSSPTDRPPHGIAMLKRDISELELLLKKGTPVTVILDRD